MKTSWPGPLQCALQRPSPLRSPHAPHPAKGAQGGRSFPPPPEMPPHPLLLRLDHGRSGRPPASPAGRGWHTQALGSHEEAQDDQLIPSGIRKPFKGAACLSEKDSLAHKDCPLRGGSPPGAPASGRACLSPCTWFCSGQAAFQFVSYTLPGADSISFAVPSSGLQADSRESLHQCSRPTRFLSNQGRVTHLVGLVCSVKQGAAVSTGQGRGGEETRGHLHVSRAAGEPAGPEELTARCGGATGRLFPPSSLGASLTGSAVLGCAQ